MLLPDRVVPIAVVTFPPVPNDASSSPGVLADEGEIKTVDSSEDKTTTTTPLRKNFLIKFNYSP